MNDPRKNMLRAAKSGDIETIQSLLSADAALLHALDTDGSTPLHCASWKGHPAVVAFLLEAGADVNAHNSNNHWGTTPLHAAAHANQAAIVQLLIDHGADVNARDMNGERPLHHTTFHKANAAAKVLRKYEEK